jgi:hypothetical protein
VPPSEFWLARRLVSTAHPLTTTHLVVWPLLPYAQIIRICYATFVSCCIMYFLLWLLCGWLRSSSGWLPACDHPTAYHHAPGRLATVPAWSIHSSMPTDLCVVFGYVSGIVVVVVRCDFREGRRVCCARRFRPPACDHPPAHHHAPGRPSTCPACSNHSNMFPDLRFVPGNIFTVVVVVWSAIERTLARLLVCDQEGCRAVCSNGRPYFPRHLVVVLPFPHGQFTPVCPLTFASYSDMSLVSWLLWFVVTLEEEGELAAPVASGLPLATESGLFERSP